jgi:hypothetical protein
MICFIVASGHGYTLKAVREDPLAPAIRIVTYDWIIGRRKLPRATYVFTDLDRLSHAEMELAGRLYLQLQGAGVRVLNNPAAAKLRYWLLRALHRAGLNDFNVYSAEEIPEAARFPVYVRQIRGHGVPCTDLLHTRQEIEDAVARQLEQGISREQLMVIEYAGEPVRPNIYRKMACLRLGSTYSPYLCGHDDQWMVKTGRVGVAGDELYQDEYRIVSDNPDAEFLAKAFAVAGIEYGRADYGYYRGRPQLFEINSNPHVEPLLSHPSARRRKTSALVWEKMLAGVRALDSEPGPDFYLPEDQILDRFRNWKRFLYRTRPAF